jgi:hypothetical protein
MKIDTNTLSSNILKHKHDLQKNIENIWNQLKQGIDNIINKNLPSKQSSATFTNPWANTTMLTMSTFFHKYLVLLIGFCRVHNILLSVITISWSDRPGSGLHLLTNDGLLVINRSRVLFFLVGKFTICSRNTQFRNNATKLHNLSE